MKYATRRTWKNDAGNQRAEPLRQYWPESLDDVLAVLHEARKVSAEVRAIGAGHSWSDVAVSTGYIIRPERLNRVLPIDPRLFREGSDPDTLFEVQSGIRLRDLNRALWDRGLGLINMGGYDAQTIVGATATSTHGSGITFGPLAEYIVSMDVVTDDGTVLRVEATDGITDPIAFRRSYPGHRLVQDNAVFHALAVGLGCMGIIYSVILRVVPRYYLKEVRTLSTWHAVRNDFRQGHVFRDNRHYEILISPYVRNGDHRCLITTRNPTDPPRGLPQSQLRRRFFTELLASLPHMDRLMNLVFDQVPQLTPRLVDASMKGLVDDGYTNRSYKVFNIGVANEIPAISAEIAFPMRDGLYIQGIERVLELTRLHQEQGRLYHTAPMAVRFVKGSPFFLSPQYGGDTCMLEIFMVRGTHGVFEMLYEYEIASYAFGGRPHWGQVNYLTGSHDLIRSMYPRYDDWMAVYRQFNGSGVFDSPFSKRVGFAGYPFIPLPAQAPAAGASVNQPS